MPDKKLIKAKRPIRYLQIFHLISDTVWCDELNIALSNERACACKQILAQHVTNGPCTEVHGGGTEAARCAGTHRMRIKQKGLFLEKPTRVAFL